MVLNKRIVIPKSQRRNILKTLHETHQGIEKCRQKAQMSVWWPGLNKEIKDMINNCRECRESRPSQKNEPLNPTQLPERPWQKVGTDLCSRNNKEYLIAVDYYSRWIEVIPLKSTSSQAVINKLRKIFATHVVPETFPTMDPSSNAKSLRVLHESMILFISQAVHIFRKLTVKLRVL